MASTARRKTSCSKYDKAAGIFTCRGCGKDYCYRHVAKHREELSKHMDELATNHDQLQQTIAEQEAAPNCHSLIEKINMWEQQSIVKVQQAANDARTELLTIINTCKIQVVQGLRTLATELYEARSDDDFVETDLNKWKEKLENLKIDFHAAQTVDFNQNDS